MNDTTKRNSRGSIVVPSDHHITGWRSRRSFPQSHPLDHLRSLQAILTLGISLMVCLWGSVCEAKWPSVQLIAFQATEGATAENPKNKRIHQTQDSAHDAQDTQDTQDTLQILLVSELMGYIEPCGCTIDLTLGAIERLSAQIKKLRADTPTVVITAGSHLFEHEHVKSHSRAQEEAKAKLIRRIFSELGVDVHMPGPLDLAGGTEFYRAMQKQYPLNEVTLNHSELSPQGHARLVERGGVKIGVFGVMGSAPSAHSTHKKSKQNTTPVLSDGERLTQLNTLTAETTKTLRTQGAQIIVGLAVASRRLVRSLAEQNPEVDLWVLGEKAQEESALSPIVFNSSSQRAYIVEAGDRGRHLAQLKFSQISAQGEFADPQGDHARALKKLRLKLQMKQKFSSRMPSPFMKRQVNQLQAQISKYEATPPQASGKRVEYHLIPITDKLPADQHIYAQVKAYQESLQDLNQAARKVKPPPANGNGYAGQAECALCHPSAQEFWKKTKHAQAWETLVKAKKTFDVECVSCHVTGWQEPGGSALGHTDQLQDVQCEACHGPAAKHAEIGGGESYVKLKVPSQRCETCHNQKHSPKFNYETYRKKIIGPGHGAPLSE